MIINISELTGVSVKCTFYCSVDLRTLCILLFL